MKFLVKDDGKYVGAIRVEGPEECPVAFYRGMDIGDAEGRLIAAAERWVAQGAKVEKRHRLIPTARKCFLLIPEKSSRKGLQPPEA